MIKTSVIVPVYNTSEYLKECFESIFNQTQKEIEIIAIDDGSTDDSLQILRKLQKEHSEVLIISQENKGLGAARNKGLELAQGEFVYFMDSDDCLICTALETCYEYAKKNQLDIVMFDAEVFGDIKKRNVSYDREQIIIDKEKVLTGEEFARKYWLRTFCPSACLIYTSTKFLKKNNLKFLSRIYFEDNEFYCKTIPLAEKLIYVPIKMYKRRFREQSITTSSFDMRHANDYLQMIQEIGKHSYSKEMQSIIHEIQLRFLKGLLDLCKNNSLLEEHQFVVRMFIVSQEICGSNIEKIDKHCDLDILERVGSILLSQNYAYNKVLQKIHIRKDSLLQNIFTKVQIYLDSGYVGIYGTGEYANRFLNECLKYLGKTKANIIFIDSNVITRKKKLGKYDIFNVNDIEEIGLKHIIVASSKYEQEICELIKRKYGDNIKVIRLLSDLHF